MPINRKDYVLTTHLRERFVQRTNKRYNHIQNCKMKECRKCDKLKKEIHFEIAYEKRSIDAELYRRIELAEENRSYLNNTGYMDWYYEKYGFDKRYEFLVHEDLTFVVVIDEGNKVVKTCLYSKSHIAGRSHNSKKKYKKIRQEDEIAEYI